MYMKWNMNNLWYPWTNSNLSWSRTLEWAGLIRWYITANRGIKVKFNRIYPSNIGHIVESSSISTQSWQLRIISGNVPWQNELLTNPSSNVHCLLFLRLTPTEHRVLHMPRGSHIVRYQLGSMATASYPPLSQLKLHAIQPDGTMEISPGAIVNLKQLTRPTPS